MRLTQDQEEFLDSLINKIAENPSQELLDVFDRVSKKTLLEQYCIKNISLHGKFDFFKEIVSNEFGAENAENMTIELIARMHDKFSNRKDNTSVSDKNIESKSLN